MSNENKSPQDALAAFSNLPDVRERIRQAGIVVRLREQATTQPAKLGRKPHGDTAMYAAERKRRSRERQKATGTKQFQLQVQGMHLQYVEALAARQEISTSAALRRILEPALHHYVFVMRHGEQMLANGATAEEVDQFLQTYWIPELPPVPESNAR